MKTFTWINTVFICCISWISVSLAQTVKVQPGQTVTLLSPKTTVTVMTWSRLVNTTKATCICYMIGPNKTAQCCDGFNNGNFEMRANTTNVFLRIKKVDLSDSGIYFCVNFNGGKNTYYVKHLHVEGSDLEGTSQTQCENTHETSYLMSWIIGALTVFLLVVVTGLVVSIRKLQTRNEERKPQQQEILRSDDLNYAAVNFRQKERRREVEPNVVYSATR